MFFMRIECGLYFFRVYIEENLNICGFWIRNGF